MKTAFLIDNDLSVAITKIDRRIGADFVRSGNSDVRYDSLVISFAFRRVSAKWYKSSSDVRSRAFHVIVVDDRSNKYESSPFILDFGALTWTPLEGTPPAIEQMPVGFTWAGKISIRMPQTAPIAKVELERERFRGMFQQSDTRRFAMSSSTPTIPDFEFDIPSHLLLSEGATIEAGRDLRSKVGHLIVRDSFTAKDFGPQRFGAPRSDRGLFLSLPIEFTNMDYNVRTATVPRIWIQFEDGQVVDTSGEAVIQRRILAGQPRRVVWRAGL